MIQFSKLRAAAVAAVVINILFAARPFKTDDARTVAPSGFELELGTNMWQDDAIFGLSFKYGLTNRIDVGVNLGYTMLPDSADGFENAEVGFKFAILPGLLSTSFTTVLGDLDYVVNGILTHAFGPVEFDINLGFATTGMGGIDGDFIYGLAAIYVVDKFGFGAEVSGNQDEVQSWLAGVRYTVFSSLALDGGIAGGFQEGADQTITAGVHYEF